MRRSAQILQISGTAIGLCLLSGTLRAQPAVPEDPSRWVCREAVEPDAARVEQFCAEARGRPLASPEAPATVWDLEKKNAYDLALQALLRNRPYARPCGSESEAGPCGWAADPAWRPTGPYAGPIGAGRSIDTHGLVRVFYSPEVVDWLCRGREGALPAGAAVVAEVRPVDPDSGMRADPESGCLSTVEEELPPASWEVMIKSPGASRDGWYWGSFSRQGSDQLPLRDASAVSGRFYAGPPRIPRVSWYPSGELKSPLSRAGRVYDKLPDVIRPRAQFGAPCLRCHAAAESESSFASLGNILGLFASFRHFPGAPGGQPEQGATSQYRSPFASVRRLPQSGFEELFGPLDVDFGKVWDSRLPAETYDHVAAPPGEPSGFLTSDQCKTCHDASPQPALAGSRVVETSSGSKINLSAYSEWRASPMGLSARDPFFLGHLEAETLRLPGLADCVEQLCLTCHAPMGVGRFLEDRPGVSERCASLLPASAGAAQGREGFRLEQLLAWQEVAGSHEPLYGALARDGVSCTVCHRLKKAPEAAQDPRIRHFWESPGVLSAPAGGDGRVALPMENAVGARPRSSEWLTDSAMCGSCHDALLPVFDNEGKQVLVGGEPRYDYRQATHLEWLNSRYSKAGPDFRSCGDCHMPKAFRPLSRQGPAEIRVESAHKAATLDSRHPARPASRDQGAAAGSALARHALHGINLLLNEVFQQFPLILGIRQLDSDWGESVTPALITARNSMLQMAEQETATIEILDSKVGSDNILQVQVQITNRAGHKLPSGTGIHRIFVEMVVEDASGEPIWGSGLTDGLGFLRRGVSQAILESEQPLKHPEAAFPPHRQIIDRPEQVQIYQILYKDSSGDCRDGTVGGLTTSLLRSLQICKDNRIRPAGYDPAFFAASRRPEIQRLAALHGSTAGDPDYTDPGRAGSDVLTYAMDLGDSIAEAVSVRATLYSQTIPPPYLQEQFAQARGAGGGKAAHIERVYHITGHLDSRGPRDDRGIRFLQGRKVKLSSAEWQF